MSLKGKNIQADFIQRLKQAVPANHSLPEVLADLLGVSTDSAYRRIRSETALTIDELTKICEHYKIAFDFAAAQETGSVTFTYQRFENAEENGFGKYLFSMLQDIKIIQSFENKQIIYAAEDIPVFYHFRYPELAAFKMMYWNKSILDSPDLKDKQFDPALIPQNFIQAAKEIFEVYVSIPSIEIWTDSTIFSTLKQVEYYWESGFFKKKEDALTICDQISDLLNTVQHQASQNRKFIDESKNIYENNFTLYYSEVVIGNSSVLVNRGSAQSVYIIYHTFNTLTTSNARFCSDTDQWIKNLIKKSVMISGVSEKQRNRFFSNNQEEVKKLRKKIQ